MKTRNSVHYPKISMTNTKILCDFYDCIFGKNVSILRKLFVDTMIELGVIEDLLKSVNKLNVSNREIYRDEEETEDIIKYKVS